MTTPPRHPAPPAPPIQDPDHPDRPQHAWQPSDDWDRLLADGSVEIREFGGAECDDVSIDDDGRHIRYRGQLLAGGHETAPGSREWQAGGARYYCVSVGERQHLLIVAGAGTLLIEDWHQGDLGIRLHDLHRPGATEAHESRARPLRGAIRSPRRHTERQRPSRNHRQGPGAGDDEPEGESDQEGGARPVRATAANR